MSKVLSAACAAGVVVAEGVPLPLVTILSEGIGSSTGIAVLDEDAAYYLAKISPDLKTTLTQVVTALNQIASILTDIGAGMTGSGTAPPPTLATDILVVTNAATALNTLSEVLR